jgi:hypothetical protein
MTALSGCAQGECAIEGAIKLAFNQADAYAKAARNMQATQDILMLGLLRSAGLVASGALEGVDDVVLAERAIRAAGVQQVATRYTPRTAVQALYSGASRMNCVAIVGKMYEEVNLADLSKMEPGTGKDEQLKAIPIEMASFTMVLAMREIEYRTLYGVSRNVEDFSNLVKAFEAATTAATGTTIGAQKEGGPSIERRLPQLSAPDALIEREARARFFKVISGCLENSQIRPNTDPS